MIVKIDRLRYDTETHCYVWLRNKAEIKALWSNATLALCFYAILGRVVIDNDAGGSSGMVSMAFYANHAEPNRLAFGIDLASKYNHDFNLLLMRQNKHVKKQKMR